MSNDVQIVEQKSDITPEGESPAEQEADKIEVVVAAKTPPKAELLDKAPSPLHESLALYIGDKTGYPISSEVAKIVQLVLALHGEHQASSEWKAKKAAIESAKAAAKAQAKAKTTARVETQVAKKVDKIGEALNAGIEMLKAGVKLPDDVLAGMRATALARGIVLPGDEPKAEEAKPEVVEAPVEKAAKPQRPSRAAKAAVGRAVSEEAAQAKA